jgi:hypothetical protein
MRNSFGIGDIVNVGKASTEWEITEEISPAVYTLKSAKGSTRKNVSWDTLTLVRDAAPAVSKSTDDALLVALDTEENDVPTRTTEYPMPIWEVELSDAAGDSTRPYLLTVDHVTTPHKSYGAACDALIIASREGVKHYAVIDHQGKRLATRTAA